MVSGFNQHLCVHRYGIRAFDTAPYYDNSEIVLGTALKALESEFPRSTYKLLTKVGRYGATNFDYTRTTIRRSVRRSLQRLHTQYLDVVFLHDVEFVAPCIAPRAEGNHSSALAAEAAAYGLASEQDISNDGEGGGGSTGSMVAARTPGDDERILEAISELRALQADGLIRQVGISGPSVSHPRPIHSLKQNK
jgi:D-arabinose 1-dehydrogenase